MAILYLEPLGSGFPGGVAGGYAVGDTTYRSQTAPTFAVGTRAKDVRGYEYTLVKAGAAIAVNELVAVNATLSDVRKSSAPNQTPLGIADTAFASGDYGWLLTRGNATVLCNSDVVANDALGCGYTAGTAARAEGSLFRASRVAALTAHAAGSCTARIF